MPKDILLNGASPMQFNQGTSAHKPPTKNSDSKFYVPWLVLNPEIVRAEAWSHDQPTLQKKETSIKLKILY